MLLTILLLSFVPNIASFNMTSHITLPENTIIIDDEIDNDLMTRAIGELYLTETSDIYMYINSNGGSVHAGNRLIEQMKYMMSQDRAIKCIGHKMISMAFVIFQYCTHRYSLSTSVAMQHQMSLMVAGAIENINSYMMMAKSMYKEMVIHQANRIGMKVSEFREKVKTDWWTYGYDIVKNNISDKIVSVGCETLKKCPFT